MDKIFKQYILKNKMVKGLAKLVLGTALLTSSTAFVIDYAFLKEKYYGVSQKIEDVRDIYFVTRMVGVVPGLIMGAFYACSGYEDMKNDF